MKNLETIREKIESKTGLTVRLLEQKSSVFSIEVGCYSSSGKELFVMLFFDGTWRSFCKEFRRFARNLDPNELSRLWLSESDESVSVIELAKDAETEKKLFDAVAVSLDAEAFWDDWSENLYR